MNVWNLLEPWANVIVPTLLHFVWQGALVGVIAVALARVLHRSRPTVRYAVDLGLFAVMAAAPLMTAAVLFQGVPLALPVSSTFEPLTPAANSHWQSQWHTEDAVTTWVAWQPSVLLLWMGGVGLFSLRLTGGLIWYGWLSRRLEPIPHELTAVVRRLSQRLGLTASVRVMLSHDVREPLAMRIIQPLIVLPASWLLSAPPLVVEAVLAHELAHIRRHDLWVNLLQRVVETLLFFHPAVWWLSRVIRQERELCCDALAVAATGRAVEYAQALEAVARFRLAWSSPAMAAGMGGDRMALLERVRRVLGLETASETGWWPVGLAGLLLAVVSGTGVFLSSGVVQGDEDKPAAKVEDPAKEDEPKKEVEADRPRPPREGDRRDPLRGEGREGDRPRPPREGDRPDGPRREGDRGPQPPREGDRGLDDRPRPPRDGERGPDDRPREGRGPVDLPRPPRGERDPDEFMRELLMTVRELRQEVQMLREEMRSMRGPRPGDGPREGDAFRPRGDFVPGRGPSAEGRGPQPPREGDGRPRGDVAPGREGRGPQPPRGEGREPGPRPEGAPRGERREEEPRRPPGRAEETPDRRPEGERKPEAAPAKEEF